MPTLKKLLQLLSAKEKRSLSLLVAFSIAISLVETVGISAIMPFISVVTDFSIIHTNVYYQKVYQWFVFEADVDFVVVFGIVLLGFYLFRAVLNLLYFHLMARFVQGRYYSIATRLFGKYLSFRYIDFVGKNTNTLTKSIVTETILLSGIIGNILLMISELFIAVFLYGMMLWVNWKITVLFSLIMGVKILFLTQFISKKLKALGVVRVKAKDKLFKAVGSTFGNFKLIKLQGFRPFLQREYEQAVHEAAKANIANTTFSNVPRLFLETSGFSLLIAVTVFVVWKQQGNIAYLIPSISLFVLSLYRLLPSVNRIMTAYNGVLYNQKALDIVWDDLHSQGELLGDDEVVFKDKIEVSDLWFSYSENTELLKNISLTIHKGEKIGFKGESGAGKSTLVDLIIGLYSPDAGSIKVDEQLLNASNLKSWRSKIGYIPQQVYLFDGTVAENVAFGREYDEQLLIDSLRQANIYQFLLTKEGLHTRVGDGGIQLSGGQKQRIAIARALYGKPQLLILDEATSALDSDTEAKIMEEIYNLSAGRTMIIIAHRLNTIARCDRIYEIAHGKSKAIPTEKAAV